MQMIYRLETKDGFGPYWYDTTKYDFETHTNILIEHDDPDSQGLSYEDSLYVHKKMADKWKFGWTTSDHMSRYVVPNGIQRMHESHYRVAVYQLQDHREGFWFRDGQILFNPEAVTKLKRMRYKDFLNVYAKWRINQCCL